MRRFTVSALGPLPPQELPPRGNEVRLMKQHWEKNLDQVLPEQPDLIVLHECCNRFPAMTMEDRLQYCASCLECNQEADVPIATVVLRLMNNIIC